jgi:hypothetical protein
MLDLFVYWHAVAPRDTAWESVPLVLHDERLITVRVGWPPHEPEQPRDLVEDVTRILGHHLGSVSSFCLHSSLSPDVDTLGCWMDLLLDRRVDYLQLVPGRIDRAQLPLQRLKTDMLGTMVIGFFNILPLVLTDNNHWCDGIHNLGTLTLIGYKFSVDDLSVALRMLGCLWSLTLGSCNLLAGNEEATMLVESLSLRNLRFWSCIGKTLVIYYAPVLSFLEIGISSVVASAASVSVELRAAAALREIRRVMLPLHSIEIYGALGPAFMPKRRMSLHCDETGLLDTKMSRRSGPWARTVRVSRD